MSTLIILSDVCLNIFLTGFGFVLKNMAIKVLKNAEELNEFHSSYSYTLMCPCICHFNIFTLTHVYASTHLPFNQSIPVIVFIHIKVSLRSASFTWDIKITGIQYLFKILFVWGKKKSHILKPINLKYAIWWVLTNAFTCANQSMIQNIVTKEISFLPLLITIREKCSSASTLEINIHTVPQNHTSWRICLSLLLHWITFSDIPVLFHVTCASPFNL